MGWLPLRFAGGEAGGARLDAGAAEPGPGGAVLRCGAAPGCGAAPRCGSSGSEAAASSKEKPSCLAQTAP